MTRASPATDTESTLDEGTEGAEATVGQGDKIAAAVRLTREAVQAWVDVIHPAADEPIATR